MIQLFGAPPNHSSGLVLLLLLHRCRSATTAFLLSAMWLLVADRRCVQPLCWDWAWVSATLCQPWYRCDRRDSGSYYKKM
jgi:hypothetical protein